MNDKVKIVLSFIAGAAVGTAITWKFTKKRYEQIAQEEIDSVKEVFLNRTTAKEATLPEDDEPNVIEYANQLMTNGYASDSNKYEKKETVSSVKDPYVIPPEEFGVLDDYETVSLTYYADQVLADENDLLIEDIEAVVGYEALTHFGEYEDDSVFVRNDAQKCDYEILLDQRKYYDIANGSED